MKKILNLKLATMLEYSNIKTFLQNVTVQIGLEKLFVIKKLANAVRWTYIINDLDSEDIFGTFHEKELQKKQIKKSLKLKK